MDGMALWDRVCIWIGWKEVQETLDYRHAYYSPWARRFQEVTGLDIETVAMVFIAVIAAVIFYLWFSRRQV